MDTACPDPPPMPFAALLCWFLATVAQAAKRLSTWTGLASAPLKALCEGRNTGPFLTLAFLCCEERVEGHLLLLRLHNSLQGLV